MVILHSLMYNRIIQIATKKGFIFLKTIYILYIVALKKKKKGCVLFERTSIGSERDGFSRLSVS